MGRDWWAPLAAQANENPEIPYPLSMLHGVQESREVPTLSFPVMLEGYEATKIRT